MGEVQLKCCTSPIHARWCVFSLQSGGNSLVRCLQDDASHLVGMREKRDVAGRDLTGRCLAPLRRPAMLLGMEHALFGPKKRPRWEGLPCWPPGFRLEDTRLGRPLRYRQSSCLPDVTAARRV